MLLQVSKFHLFWRLNHILLTVYTTFCLSIHVSMDTWVVCTFWPLVNSAAMNMVVQTPIPVPAFISFRYIARSEIASSNK